MQLLNTKADEPEYLTWYIRDYLPPTSCRSVLALGSSKLPVAHTRSTPSHDLAIPLRLSL